MLNTVPIPGELVRSTWRDEKQIGIVISSGESEMLVLWSSNPYAVTFVTDSDGRP